MDRDSGGFRSCGWCALLAICVFSVPDLLAAQIANPFASETVGGLRLSVGMEEAWTTNVQFQSTTGPASSVTRVHGEAARLWQGRRDRSVVTVGGAIVQYGQQSQLNQYSYDLGVATTHQFARVLASEVSVRANSTLTNQTVLSSGSGALLTGLYQVRSAQANAGLSYRLSRRLEGRLIARAQTVAVAGLANGDGRVEAASVDLTGRASRSTRLGLNAEYQRSAIGSSAVVLPRVAIHADQQLTPLLSFAAVAASSVGSGVGAISRPQLSGSGTLSFRDRTTSLSIDARRTVGQEFGQASNGILITDNAGLSYGLTISQTLQILARGSQAWTRGFSTGSRPIKSSEASTEIRYTSRANIAFSIRAFLAKREEQRRVISSGVSAGVAYNWSQLHVAR